MTAQDIIKVINAYYSSNCRYKLPNAYIFKRDWESDFFVQKQNGYCYEFEIKISRSDFFADTKKVSKHLILETGKYKNQRGFFDAADEITEVEYLIRPNKFFYAMPHGLISIEEIPSYAGLVYIENGCFITVKEAPFIHKEVIDFSKILCPKFYAYWIDAKIEVRKLKQIIEGLEYEIQSKSK